VTLICGGFTGRSGDISGPLVGVSTEPDPVVKDLGFLEGVHTGFHSCASEVMLRSSKFNGWSDLGESVKRTVGESGFNKIRGFSEERAVMNFDIINLNDPKAVFIRGIDPNFGNELGVDRGFKVVEAINVNEVDFWLWSDLLGLLLDVLV